MRGVVVLLMAMAAIPIDAAQRCAARAWPDRDMAVTIRIHDYERLPGKHLSRASDIVTRIYEKSGIRTEWLGVLQPDTHRKHSATEPRTRDDQIADVTLIIVRPEMAARGRVPRDVLGYAAVPPDGSMGRIAYVLYDRIRQVAAKAPANEVELLGFVMAHETGHLLLGRGSGTESGLMKCHWDYRGVRQFDPLKLAFSELQSGRIRNALMNASPPPTLASIAGTGDACEASAERRPE
jgi:hypothetical protein